MSLVPEYDDIDAGEPAESRSSRRLQQPSQEQSLPVGYVAKRFRRAASASNAVDDGARPNSVPSAGAEAVRADEEDSNPKKRKTFEADVPMAVPSAVPVRRIARLLAHSAAINTLHWSPDAGRLLASASMDKTVRLWESDLSLRCSHQLRGHSEGVRDAQWSYDGKAIYTASFDKTSKRFDVSTGTVDRVFQHSECVLAVRLHPSQKDLLITGTSKADLLSWDIRSGGLARTFRGAFGQVQDVEFLDENLFVSSSEVTSRGTADKTLLVWDLRAGCVISNQIYMEVYSCPAIRKHPYRSSFVAQSNGNYIAIFGSKSPFKMNKHKRFEGHQVSGFRVQCNFSTDGEILASGSADGYVYYYGWNGQRILKSIRAHEDVCTDVAFHPARASLVASASWRGELALWSDSAAV